MINYELGLLIAITAFVYSTILTEPNAIFCGLYNKLHDLFKTDQRKEQGKPYHPLFMVLIHCEKCIAGQMAFWLFIYARHEIYLQNFFENIVQHFFFVAYSILMAWILKTIYDKL